MSNDLVTQTSALPALPEAAMLREVFESNFEGVQPSFEVIKTPPAGLTTWEVPTDSGESEPVKELVGTILDHYAVRAYWDREMGDGAGVPPTCSSLGAKQGTQPRNSNGEFGDCATCKWSQFGTAVKNGQAQRGQGCSLKHRVFFLMPDRGILPYLVNLATTSATKKYEGSLSTFMVKLAGKLKKPGDVVTKIKLIKDRNAEGIEYAKAQFFVVADLSDEDKKKVGFLKNAMGPLMRSKPFEVEEAETTNGNGGGDPWDVK
jgi:hypothetical protein